MSQNGTKSAQKGLKSYTVRIRGKALEQVDELKAKTSVPTATEVVKNALRTYKALQAHMDPDGGVVIERPDGKKVRLVLP